MKLLSKSNSKVVFNRFI